MTLARELQIWGDRVETRTGERVASEEMIVVNIEVTRRRNYMSIKCLEGANYMSIKCLKRYFTQFELGICLREKDMTFLNDLGT